GFYALFGIDPSIIPASLLANDMGGAVLAQSVSKSAQLGNYNAFIVSSMMGCVISFTLPFSLGAVSREQYSQLFLGILCGIATIPVGCLVAGLVCRVPLVALMLNLLPLVIVGSLITLALLFFKKACIRCFAVLGHVMRAISLAGLACAIFTFLTGVVITPHFDTLQNGALVCANACVTLSGALPLMYLLTKLLHKPLNAVGARIGINDVSAIAFLGTLVTNASTFGTMDKMDKRGAVLNAAFAVSASFALGDHLAFTMAYDGTYVLPMIVGKIVSGVCAVLLAFVMMREKKTIH
ncbi:MAG: ethanolamine utilization protein EutH, partial [Clostridia bacterium]|nr:ethanolamine utilization protein EutH [Clostridia bacterium]